MIHGAQLKTKGCETEPSEGSFISLSEAQIRFLDNGNIKDGLVGNRGLK